MPVERENKSLKISKIIRCYFEQSEIILEMPHRKWLREDDWMKVINSSFANFIDGLLREKSCRIEAVNMIIFISVAFIFVVLLFFLTILMFIDRCY